jgi:hypothetical protein
VHWSTENHPVPARPASHFNHSFNMCPLWDLLNEWLRDNIAGSVGAGRPGNAGLPTGARPVPAHDRPGGPAGPAGR